MAFDNDVVVARASKLLHELVECSPAVRADLGVVEAKQRVGGEADATPLGHRIHGHRCQGGGRRRGRHHHWLGRALWRHIGRRGGRARPGLFGAAERKDRAQRHHVDLAVVAHRVVDAVALGLGAQQEVPAELVLHAGADLDVGFALARVRVQHADGPGAAEAVTCVGRLHAEAAEQRPLLADGQRADEVEVQATQLDIAAERAGGRGGRLEAEAAEAEVARLDGDVAVELVAAEDLVAGVALVACHSGGRQSCA